MSNANSEKDKGPIKPEQPESPKEPKGPKDESQPNTAVLVFVVNGKEAVIEKVNIHQPLHVAANEALKKTGNTARPLSDWLVKLENADLDLSEKVENFHFGSNARIFMSLKGAEGGND